MIYTLLKDYVVQPLINAATPYMHSAIDTATPYIRSMMNFAYNKGVAVVTIGVTGAAITQAAKLAMPEQDPVAPFVDPRPFQERAKEMAKDLVKGMVSENVTQASLKALNSVAPVPAPVLYLAPRATNLTLTSHDNSATAAKHIAFGALSHGFGTVVQEQVDALLPQAAPYGGYIAYGIASSAARVGLDQVARKIAL